MHLGKLIVSFGGGVNSAAMLIGMKERSIQPDLILFADTGGERPNTYAFTATMSDWTRITFGLEIVTVKNDGIYGQLEVECLLNKTLPSIVFGWRSCSDKYKLRPQKKYAAHKYPGEVVTWAVGIDAGEIHRIGAFENCVHPLVDWGWDRKDCVAAIERANLPVPEKSACFFCPSSKKKEIIRLAKEHPDLYARAIAMEHNTKGLSVAGLGRSWSWESVVKADEAQFKMFPESADIPCVCFDGEAADQG